MRRDPLKDPAWTDLTTNDQYPPDVGAWIGWGVLLAALFMAGSIGYVLLFW